MCGWAHNEFLFIFPPPPLTPSPTPHTKPLFVMEASHSPGVPRAAYSPAWLWRGEAGGVEGGGGAPANCTPSADEPLYAHLPHSCIVDVTSLVPHPPPPSPPCDYHSTTTAPCSRCRVPQRAPRDTPHVVLVPGALWGHGNPAWQPMSPLYGEEEGDGDVVCRRWPAKLLKALREIEKYILYNTKYINIFFFRSRR